MYFSWQNGVYAYAHHIPKMSAYIHGIAKHDNTTNQLKNDHAF